jgi:Uma2 family endonuclease
MNVIRQRLMTVAEFQDWEPDHHADHRWHLIDGIPVCMAPPISDHGRIIGRLTSLLMAHVDATMPGCDVVVGTGVIPSVASSLNHRIPDIGVTCEPASKISTMNTPIVLVEVLSPSNAHITRDSSGHWPSNPLVLDAEAELDLRSIGFRTPLRGIYRTTSLAT